ncbi:MAG: ATP-grasp domain-containing protein [Nitrospirota bacterium]|nr:ATP-grasp domain-containing protein [Nitrospirota bacterium]MDP2382723.1 ATP-grasp domain-containing protein [Nitrospirota bacterium]MDP3597102.1 ATP-grasp domain-containing protein [Nitrospirota bacterium]
MKILVTDGDNRAALAITRSLGSKGHSIVVGEKVQPSLAQTSRHCVESVIYPDPVLDSVGFVQTLLRTMKELQIDVVLPVAEITTALVAEHKSAFEQHSRVPFPDVATFDRAANKVDVLALAEKLSIPIPTGVVLTRPGDRPQWPEGLSFPIVVKPHRSRILVNGTWQSTAVTYAENANDLTEILAAKHPSEYPILLQQRIVGPGVGVFMCYQRGKLVAQFSHRRLREKPPSGGVSVLRESVPVSPQAKRYAQALLDALSWQGVAMVEFKMDQADQTLKLMEINGRFWGSLQLAIDAGVDFPALLLQTMADEPLKPVDTYRVGVKSRWFLGDLDALMMRLLKRQDLLHLPPGHDGKLRSIIRFMRLWEKDTYSEIFRFSDMNPGFYEARRWFSNHD